VEWDTYKKYTNPYEYIHTNVPTTKQSICKYRPISRAFFKLNEIINDMGLFDDAEDRPVRTFHLAEGPGGFIEAVALLRDRNPEDEYTGMTLLNEEDENVPGWDKVQTFLAKTPTVKLELGATGTGDLLEPENLKHCYMKYKNTMDLITADGGFDFSKDYNRHEDELTRLLLAQVFFGVAMQKKGGHFVLKVFDMCTQVSIDVAFLLNSLYEEVYVVKPHTSRYANSERYLVCKGFSLAQTEAYGIRFYQILTQLHGCPRRMISLLSFPIPSHFLDKLQEINAILGQQQIESIKTTLALIRSRDNERIEQLRKSAIHRCLAYCQKHNLAHHKAPPQHNVFLTKTS
jgi:23S rRNA U2552 (ribose-2'-O)-methylase RlmE/FtsJ